MKIRKTTPLAVILLIISLACSFPILGLQDINGDGEGEQNESTQTALAQTMTPTRRDKSGIPTNTKQPTIDKSQYPTNTKPPTINPPANPPNPPPPTPTNTAFIPPPIVNPPEFPAFPTTTPTRTRRPTQTNTPLPTVSFTASNPSVFLCGNTQYVEVYINNNSTIALEFANMRILHLPNNYGYATDSPTPFHDTSHDCGPGDDKIKSRANAYIRIEPWRKLRSGHSYKLIITLNSEDYYTGLWGQYTISSFTYNP